MKFFVTDKKFSKAVKLQATTEGEQSELEMDSMLTGSAVSGSDGCGNSYKTYSAQVSATYRKYRGSESLGNWQTRAITDIRTAFISGEGLSVNAGNPETSIWIEKFMLANKLKGSRFFEFVKEGEMSGKGLFTLHADKKKDNIIIKRIPTENEGGKKYTCTPLDLAYPGENLSITIDKKPLSTKDFIFVKVHGLPCELNETYTKVGACLNLIDRYDLGMNAMRKNNHLFGRITPFFECETEGAVSKISALIKKGWKIGKAIAAYKTKMHLVVPELGAMDNIKAELGTNVKAIAAVTGIPVHWLGHVDMMSNRSTADSLYETISNGTINERAIWAESFYELIFKAMEMSINSGLKSAAKKLDPDFEVTIPLVSFTKMYQYVQALSLAFNDGAIALADYTNMLPGVDPLRVKQNKLDEAKLESKATEELIKKTKLLNPEEGNDV